MRIKKSFNKNTYKNPIQENFWAQFAKLPFKKTGGQLPKAQFGWKAKWTTNYNDWIKSAPNDRKSNNYNLKRAFYLAPKEELEAMIRAPTLPSLSSEPEGAYWDAEQHRLFHADGSALDSEWVTIRKAKSYNRADVNRDGTVDSADIVAVIKEMPDGDKKADVNNDGAIDSADIVAVTKVMK